MIAGITPEEFEKLLDELNHNIYLQWSIGRDISDVSYGTYGIYNDAEKEKVMQRLTDSLENVRNEAMDINRKLKYSPIVYFKTFSEKTVYISFRRLYQDGEISPRILTRKPREMWSDEMTADLYNCLMGKKMGDLVLCTENGTESLIEIVYLK